MRLELLFALDKPEMIQDYRKIFISYIKNALSKINHGQFYDKYYGSVEQKNYSFSIIMPSAQFKGNRIELSSNQIKMIFTAGDKDRTNLVFFSSFIKQKNIPFPLPDGNFMTLKKINQLNEHLIVENKAIFRTVTGGGIVIREHNHDTNRDCYYTVLDDGFEAQMRLVLQVQAKNAGFSDEIAKNIGLHPIQCKKVVVKHFGVYVDATVGIFEMEGDSELLQYFYQSGLGSRHSQGFGMVDIIPQS